MYTRLLWVLASLMALVLANPPEHSTARTGETFTISWVSDRMTPDWFNGSAIQQISQDFNKKSRTNTFKYLALRPGETEIHFRFDCYHHITNGGCQGSYQERTWRVGITGEPVKQDAGVIVDGENIGEVRPFRERYAWGLALFRDALDLHEAFPSALRPCRWLLVPMRY